MTYLSNAFSLNMLSGESFSLKVTKVPVEAVIETLKSGFKSVCGHADTARLFSEILGIPVESNRETLKLQKGDTLIVGQYSGPRLPEGCTQLPPGATIEWYMVEIS